jgi:hypothetical protein
MLPPRRVLTWTSALVSNIAVPVQSVRIAFEPWIMSFMHYLEAFMISRPEHGIPSTILQV